MTKLQPLIPLIGIVSLFVIAVRRRREKKKRFEGRK